MARGGEEINFKIQGTLTAFQTYGRLVGKTRETVDNVSIQRGTK